MSSPFEAAAKARSEEELLSELASLLRTQFRADSCDLLLRQEPGSLSLAASTDFPEMVGRVQFNSSAGVVGQVLAGQQPVVVSDAAKTPESALEFPGFNTKNFESHCFFLLSQGSEPMGAAILRRRESWSPTTDELDQIQTWCDQCTSAILIFRNAFNLGTEDNRFGALRKVTATIAQSPYLEEIIQLLVNLTAQQFGYRVCTVRLLDEKTNELVLRATQASMPEYQRKRSIHVGESIAGKAVLEMKTIIVEDVQAEESYIGHDLAEQQGLRSMVCTPMTIHGSPIGVLTCYTDEIREFTTSEVAALETIAKQAAFSIERAKLQVRNTLMQEMHHRVKNNLQQIVSLLRLQLSHKHYRSIDDAINDSISRITAIAAVHDLLSREDLDRVGLKTIAESLVGHIKQGVISSERKVEFEVRGDDVQLTMTPATQVILILNELIQNALEHGFGDDQDGQIHVTFESHGDDIQLWAANNGNPLPPGFDSAADAHLGLQIVSNLTRALNGSFRIFDSFGWTVVEIKFQRGHE